MVSKTQQAKDACGYTDTPVLPVCGNCKHFCSTMVLPSWMAKELEKTGELKVYPHPPFKRVEDIPAEFLKESGLRCGLHGFAIKKMGACKTSWTPRS